MRYGDVTGKLGALAGTFSQSLYKMLESKGFILPNTTMPRSFLPHPEINLTTYGCQCRLETLERNIVRKPWIKPAEKQPSNVTYLDGWSLPAQKWHIGDTRILCFYHAEHFRQKWNAQLIESSTGVEELQLQFGCSYDPEQYLGRIFDNFLKLPNTAVKSLTLDTITRVPLPFPEVLNFICSFSNLEDLRVGGALISPFEKEDWKKIIPNPSPLRGLTGTFISEGGSRYFISQLSEQETVCRFREIVQRRLSVKDEEGMKKFVKACSKTLESIRIHGCKSWFGSRRIGSVSDRF